MSDHDSKIDPGALPLPPVQEGGLFGGAEGVSDNGAARESQPYRVLARKYRPQNFDDLIGQESTVRILRRAFLLGRVAHAFMLTGVRGVGKTTTARIIARALNCTGTDGTGGPTADPCGVCANCVAILADRHPDVLEMDAASRTGVDDIREIIEQTRFRPIQGRMKVFIIDEVHMLSRNAFNALLKTLEEPPESVTFVFATTELRKVPVTVLSRCQRFDLRRVPAESLVALFARIAEREGVAFSMEALRLVARASDGSVRDGLSLLDQAIARGAEKGADRVEEAVVSAMLGLSDREAVYDLLQAVMDGDAARALDLTAQAYAQGIELGGLLSDLLDLLHFISRIKAVPALFSRPDLTEVERVRGGDYAALFSMGVLGRAWQILINGLKELEISPDRRAATEMVLLRLCYASHLPTPDRLMMLAQQAALGQNAPDVKSSAQSTATETINPLKESESGAPTWQQARHSDLNIVSLQPQSGSALQNAEANNLQDEQGATSHSSESGGEAGNNRLRHFKSNEQKLEAQRGALVPASAVAQTVRDGADYVVVNNDHQDKLVQLLRDEPNLDAPKMSPHVSSEMHDAAPALTAPSPEAQEVRLAASGRERLQPPPVRSWREVVAFVAWASQPLLHGLLRHTAHCVRFAPPEIAIRLQSGTDPRSLTRLQAVLETHFPGQFNVTPSHEEGEPTLDEMGAQVVETHRKEMQDHPLIRAIVEHFPDAKLGVPRDLSLDDYGLPPENLDDAAVIALTDDLIREDDVVDASVKDNDPPLLSQRYH